jgi:hypothetical protein
MRFRLLAFLAVLCFSAPLMAASPILSAISPRGAQRGTEATLYFGGARLEDAQEIIFYSPGFSVTKLEVVNGTQAKATVKIAADAALGEHAIRVRTASGISDLRTFWVGAMPEVAEKEPNSDFATPQKIPLNVTVTGVVDNEDVDYYAVECKKGQRLSVEIEGMRLATTLFDPYIAILDSKRFELATSDDSPLLGQDGMCSVLIPADGTYLVQVRESAYQGNGACLYRLHIGNFPRPRGVVPAGGKAGEEIEVTFIGDPTGPIKQRIKVPATPQEKFSISAQDATGISPSGIPFRISDVGNVLEVEPNNDHKTATRAPAFPMAFNGVIDKAGETDCFRFVGKKGQTYDVHCYARRIGSPLDSVMTLSIADGGGIVGNDDAVGPDSYFRVTLPEDREYVLTITDHLGKGGVDYAYRVEFTPVVYSVNLSIPKVALFSQERQVIPIPKGGRIATLISGGRANFGGELTLSSPNLPAGVTLNAENMAGNLDTVPVVFEAAATAAVGGTLSDIVAKHADPKHPPITSRWEQNAELVTGGPGQSVYWAKQFHRTAISVVEEMPFEIEVIEPKVPLVQNGSMQLKVIAKRKPGFAGPINVFPLFNPPGVNSASAVTIPANGTEVLMPLNAAPNAQVRKWKTALLAQSDAGKGPIWSSSRLFTLDVAAPFVAVNMERSVVEQGKETDLFVKLQHLAPFEGTAKLKLVGLPFKALAADLDITKDTKEIGFKITTDKTSPAGIHRGLFCQVIITKNGEPMVANTGASELRIDVPVVKMTPPPMPTPTPVVTPMPMPNPATPPKRLTRLEMLRKEQEEREKAGTAPPKK